MARNSRRLVLALGGCALTFPRASFAQAKPRLVGFLAPESPSVPSQALRLAALESGLAQLGYLLGRDVVIVTRWAHGRYERLPTLAQELVALRVAVIVASGGKATVAASEATSSIPIVMGATGDPVGLGLTTSLARPSRNVTGRTLFVDLSPKLLDLLRQAVPSMARVGYLVNPANRPTFLDDMQATARALGGVLSLVEAHRAEQFDDAFGRIASLRCDALILQGDTLFAAHLAAIARRALEQRLPSASSLTDYAEAGGLIAYGPDRIEGFRRAAAFVDKLLKGSRPADLPIERPTLLERIINVRTATALGLVLPRSLLLSADRLIE